MSKGTDKPFLVPILQIQPSQLYINEKKLENVKIQYNNLNVKKQDPLPVKVLNNRIILTDGHTRAVLYYLEGLEELSVYWDDPWDTEYLEKALYEKAVQWCLNERVFNIKDLSKRIISNDDYKVLWLDKCNSLQQ